VQCLGFDPIAKERTEERKGEREGEKKEIKSIQITEQLKLPVLSQVKFLLPFPMSLFCVLFFYIPPTPFSCCLPQLEDAEDGQEVGQMTTRGYRVKLASHSRSQGEMLKADFLTHGHSFLDFYLETISTLPKSFNSILSTP
jgi:hypothetical protein